MSKVRRICVESPEPVEGLVFPPLLSHFLRMNLIESALQLNPDIILNTPTVYILRLQSGGLYVGCTQNLISRLSAHDRGTASRTTRLDRPIMVLWLETHPSFTLARQRETQIKKWSRPKKEALIQENWVELKQLSQSKVWTRHLPKVIVKQTVSQI